MKKLENKIVLVTGASKGIGSGIAREMAKEGASVIVNYCSDKDAATKVVTEIRASGGRAEAIQADVSKVAEIKKLFAEAKRTFGVVDVLVNNAGVYKFEPLEAVTEQAFNNHFSVNVLSPILAVQEALNHFGTKGGCVINISSVAGAKATPYSVLYSASKSAVNSITAVLAKELGARNIRVNSIMPGLVDTEGTRKIGVIGSDNEKFMNANTSLGRTGQPHDIAKAAVFLASDDSRWITGENIAVSGGLF